MKNQFSRWLIWLVLFAHVAACNSAAGIAQKSLAEVVISIGQTRSYCGGARPSEEISKQLKEAKPLPGEWCYVRQGTTNDVSLPILDSAMTDAQGVARFKLATGNYSFVLSNKKDASYINSITSRYSGEGSGYWSNADAACLIEWLSLPELQIAVSGRGKQSFTITTNVPCPWSEIPCASYSGPLPN